MNTIMSSLRTLTYVLVSAFSLSVSTVDVANAQCKHYVYNPLLSTAQGIGGMDCVSIAMAAGTDGVTGASLLTTANRVPVVNGAGELTQSDVALASGVFSRAGTIGLSATGANSVTLATNGSTRLTINSSGVSAFSGVVTIPNSTALSFLDVGAAQGFRIYTSGNNGIVEQVNNAYLAFLTTATERMRLTGGGNLLVGTTTDGNFRLDVGSSGSTGTARFYDQNASTGVTQVVVRAGEGQSTNPLLNVVANDGTTSVFKLESAKVGFFNVTPSSRATALTAADAGALNTGDAGSDTVIGNIRTRLGELETKLQAYGLLQ